MTRGIANESYKVARTSPPRARETRPGPSLPFHLNSSRKFLRSSLQSIVLGWISSEHLALIIDRESLLKVFGDEQTKSMVGRDCVRTTALLSFSVTFPYLSVAAASLGMTVQVRACLLSESGAEEAGGGAREARLDHCGPIGLIVSTASSTSSAGR